MFDSTNPFLNCAQIKDLLRFTPFYFFPHLFAWHDVKYISHTHTHALLCPSFCSTKSQKRLSGLKIFHPQCFNCLCWSVCMYILEWACMSCTRRAVNHSDWNVCYTRDERTSVSGEPQFCASLLNWDCGAKLSFTYKRLGISQGHEVPKGIGLGWANNHDDSSQSHFQDIKNHLPLWK